jgi:hypothetical protein
MAKQVLSQRDLKTQSAISVPAAGFVAIGAKADGIYSRTESGVEKRLLNTDDVVGGGATTAAQISTIALGSTTLKFYNKFMTLLECRASRWWKYS